MGNDELRDNMREIAEAIAADEAKATGIDQSRAADVVLAYQLVCNAVNKEDVSVKYGLGEPYLSMGYVEIIGKHIIITDTATFDRALEMASNFEAHTKTDGTVEMNLTFHGLTRRDG